MRRRTGIAVAGWLLAALTATGTGLAAVQVIGAGLTGPAGEPRSPDEVARALAATRSPAAPSGPGPVPPGTPTSTAAMSTGTPFPSTSVPGSSGPADGSGNGSRRLLSTAGGTVVAECAGREVFLVSWTPAQGYRVGEVERGPDDDAEVTFHGSADRIEVEVECPAGQPVSSTKRNDD